jgi:hypothetical protein
MDCWSCVDVRCRHFPEIILLILNELFSANVAKSGLFSRLVWYRFTDSKGVMWRKSGEKRQIFFICIFSDLQGGRGTREQGNEGTREQGNRGTREQGNKGTREQGNKGAAERW